MAQSQPVNTTIAIEATTQAPDITSTEQQLIQHLKTVTAANADRWSAPNIDRRQGTHALFQYPGRMVPEVQQSLVQAVAETHTNISSMLDPYMGSATSIVASMYQGLNCHGQDINPLAILIGRVKTTWLNTAALKEAVEQVVAHVASDAQIGMDMYFPGITKWFRSDVGSDLCKLRRAIMLVQEPNFRRVLWLTLAETIRLTSNDRTSTYKLHARPSNESRDRKLDTQATFKELAERNIGDLQLFHNALITAGHANVQAYNNSVTIDLLNSTEKLVSSHNTLAFDLLVTSPPYGDNKTTIPYGEHAFLPLQWIDLADIHPNINAKWLETTTGIDRQSMGGEFYARPADTIDKLRGASPTLDSHLADLASAPAVSYRKVVAFYDDFHRSLQLIVAGLNPNAYLIWTLGNRRVNKMLIRNDSILREFLENMDCRYVMELSRIIHSKRMPHKNRSGSTMANEQILILRKND